MTNRVPSLNNLALFTAATAHPGGPQGFLADPRIREVFKRHLREAVEVNTLSLYLALKHAHPQPNTPDREQFSTDLALFLLRQRGPERQTPTQGTLRAAARSGNPVCIAAVLENNRDLLTSGPW